MFLTVEVFQWESISVCIHTKPDQIYAFMYMYKILYVSLEHRRSHKQHRYICSNRQQYIVRVIIIRILRSCSMKIFCTVNISKLNYWLLICIAKSFIWTTLKMIFSIFIFFCTLSFQIYKYCQIITNHTSMEILFIQILALCSNLKLKKWHLWLVLCSRVTYYCTVMIQYIMSQIIQPS